MKVCFQDALAPALPPPVGEGESFPVSFEFENAGFSGHAFAERNTADGCSLSRATAEGQGEGLL
jgi:hypothetical protein